VLVVHGVHPFELAVACEVFGVDRSDLAEPWYGFRIVAGEGVPVRTSLPGVTLDTPWRLGDLADADTVLVPAWQAQNDRPDEPILEALRAAHARGARIVSVCTGAFVLAHAGLLDDRRATTHWMHADDLATRFPRVSVDPDVLYVDAGDGIYTSAGSAAGIDLMLHIVRLDHGPDVANTVARRMVVPPHRDGGQAQYVEAPVARAIGDDALGSVLDWAVEHLDEPLTVDQLASRAAMSGRSFARKFPALTGTTPLQWLLAQRIRLAQDLLETTDLPVEIVASRCGFGSATVLRTHFRRILATTPNGYRRTFRRAAG
jgi:transcriptional regulator GlxA family with amidase domain